MKCPGCGKQVEKVNYLVQSCIHEHSAASKVQKLIRATVTFSKNNKGETPADICESCQLDVISGMSSGGNIE